MFSTFLETYPLYRQCVIEMHVSVYQLQVPTPPLQLHCAGAACGTERTFHAIHDFWFNLGSRKHAASFNSISSNAYSCMHCGEWSWHFILYFKEAQDEILDYGTVSVQLEKIGQSPPWDITPDKIVSQWLGDHELYYRRGLMCESQGYGIGAFSYYRRVIEDIIDQLLISISDIIDPDEQEHYAQELVRIRALHNAADKIDVVKDLLPPILRPGGWNPLDVLHGTLSEGLHKLNENECMNLAEQIRTVLVFLVRQILESKNAAQQYKDTLDKLLKRPRN